MAIAWPFAEGMEARWEEWRDALPPIPRSVALSHPPNRLYRLNGKWNVTIQSYADDGTVTVTITNSFNQHLGFERDVFGELPAHLVECELPKLEPCLACKESDGLHADDCAYVRIQEETLQGLGKGERGIE